MRMASPPSTSSSRARCKPWPVARDAGPWAGRTVMKGRVAVVTGGTGALGQAVTRRLLGAGAIVCIPYIVPEERRSLEQGLSGEARARLHGVRADVTDETAFRVFADGVLDAHHRLDVLVNGVGGFMGGDLAATTL